MHNKTLNIKCYFGTELILRYFSIFKKLLENGIYDSINVSICKELLKSCRDTYKIEDFVEKYYDIMRWVYNGYSINITDDQTYDLIHYNALESKYNTPITYEVIPELIDDFLGKKLNLPEEYITISTKIWSAGLINKSQFDDKKNILFDSLNKYRNKIIILGERNIKSCAEYNVIETYSIYSDIKNNINNYLDYTYDCSTQNNDLEDLKKSFYILAKSNLNIYMTDSGIRVTNLFLNENICFKICIIYNPYFGIT
jgi:hypothetical protein